MSLSRVPEIPRDVPRHPAGLPWRLHGVPKLLLAAALVGAGSLALLATATAVVEPAPSSVEAAGGAVAQPYPVRWRIHTVLQEVVTPNPPCSTAVFVHNLSGATLAYELEVFSAVGNSLVNNTGTIGIDTVVFGTTTSGTGHVSFKPFGLSSGLNTEELPNGHAELRTPDPRVHASAYLVCRESLNGALLSITPLAVTPVGATLEYFQAGVHGGLAPRPTIP